MADRLNSARIAAGRSLFPDEYRGVAVTTVKGELDEDALRRYFLGREAYRRTRYIVVRNGDRTAIVAVRKESDGPLFSPIVEVRVLAHETECVYLVCPDVDTAVPSAVAQVAREHAPDHRGVVVQGRYGHVSFIVDPAAVRVTVTEVVPPYPAKLVDQARRVLDVAEGIRPIELVPDVVIARDVGPVPTVGQLPFAVPGRRIRCRGCPNGVPGRAAGTRALGAHRLRAIATDSRARLR